MGSVNEERAQIQCFWRGPLTRRSCRRHPPTWRAATPPPGHDCCTTVYIGERVHTLLVRGYGIRAAEFYFMCCDDFATKYPGLVSTRRGSKTRHWPSHGILGFCTSLAGKGLCYTCHTLLRLPGGCFWCSPDGMSVPFVF